MDFALPKGTEVLNVDQGVVCQVDYHPSGWGKFVRVSHPWGISHYAHLSSVGVKVNEMVAAGQALGLSGDTGFTRGFHLHFGVKVIGVTDSGMKDWTDPTPYFEGHEAVETIRCPVCGAIFPVAG